MSEQQFLVVLLYLIKNILNLRELIQHHSLRKKPSLFSQSPFSPEVFPGTCSLVSAPLQTARWMMISAGWADTGICTSRLTTAVRNYVYLLAGPLTDWLCSLWLQGTHVSKPVAVNSLRLYLYFFFITSFSYGSFSDERKHFCGCTTSMFISCVYIYVINGCELLS